MKHFAMAWLYLLGLPNTLYFNFKYLKFDDAIKLPILVSHRVYLREMGGRVRLDASATFGMVRIGFGNVGIFDQQRSRTIWLVSGLVIFKGIANIGHGSKISVSGIGILTIGDQFSMTAESQVVCEKAITFGNNVLISWENLFLDTDFHKIKTNGLTTNLPKEIVIGNHVWIGCRCTILKGTYIGDEIIVAANSTLSGRFDQNHTIVGGNPAKVVKKQVTWEH